MKKIKISISLLVFKEEHLFYVYAPAFDIMGYDKTLKGAKQSFKEMLGFFLEHNTEQGSLKEELLRMGWVIGQDIVPPTPVLKNLNLTKKNAYLIVPKMPLKASQSSFF